MDVAVRHEGLDSLREALVRAHGDIGRDLDGLDRAVRELRGRWSGEASSAYDRAQAQWVRELERMNAILSELASFLGHVADTHRSVEAEVAALW